MENPRLQAALDLLGKILPPQDIEQNRTDLCRLLSDEEGLARSLRQRVPVPPETSVDVGADGSRRRFVQPDEDYDGASPRSPWADAPPDSPVRHMERAFNETLDVYRTLYYGRDDAAASSAYLRAADGGGTDGAVLIRKDTDDGTWSSAHRASARPDPRGGTDLDVTSTVHVSTDAGGGASLHGRLTRSVRTSVPADAPGGTVVGLGVAIENMELELSSEVGNVYAHRALGLLSSLKGPGAAAGRRLPGLSSGGPPGGTPTRTQLGAEAAGRGRGRGSGAAAAGAHAAMLGAAVAGRAAGGGAAYSTDENPADADATPVRTHGQYGHGGQAAIMGAAILQRKKMLGGAPGAGALMAEAMNARVQKAKVMTPEKKPAPQDNQAALMAEAMKARRSTAQAIIPGKKDSAQEAQGALMAEAMKSRLKKTRK